MRPRKRGLAEAGMILRVHVGSGVHGTTISGQGDRDEMGIRLEPAEFVTGLARLPGGIDDDRGEVEFEQFQRHTVGTSRTSRPIDLVLALFVPDEEVVYRDDVGAELLQNSSRFVSELAADRFLGYLRSQRAAMRGERGAHTNRPELVAEHGDDTEFAMHALRLGGRRDAAHVPHQPDRHWVDQWLHRSHLASWSRWTAADCLPKSVRELPQIRARIINTATGELIRELTIDPTRDDQPTGRPPGPDPRNRKPGPQLGSGSSGIS